MRAISVLGFSFFGKTALILILCLSPLVSSPLRAGELGLNLYGLSYHFDRKTVEGISFNEFNQGFGFNYQFVNIRRLDFSLEASLYKDSLNHTARYISLNVKYRVFTEVVKLGVLIAAYRSESVSEAWIPAVIPVLTFQYRDIGFNFVYIPEFPNINAYDSIGFYITFHFLEF